MSKRFLVLAIGVVIHACAACAKHASQEPPPCRPERLAEIEASFVAEALIACKGHTPERCEALPAIESKYARQREEWIACR